MGRRDSSTVPGIPWLRHLHGPACLESDLLSRAQTFQTYADIRLDPAALPLLRTAWIKGQCPSPCLFSCSKAAAVDADEAIGKPTKAVRKGMSAEGRRKIAEAQKARWAKQKKAAKSVAKAPAKKAAAKNTASKKAPTKKAAAVRTNEQA